MSASDKTLASASPASGNLALLAAIEAVRWVMCRSPRSLCARRSSRRWWLRLFAGERAPMPPMAGRSKR